MARENIWFHSFLIHWNLFSGPEYGFSWWMFHWHLDIPLWGSILYMSTRSNWLIVLFRNFCMFSVLFFFHLLGRIVRISNYNSRFIYFFPSSSCFKFMYFETERYIHVKVVTCSWIIDSFTTVSVSGVFLVIKSTLTDVNRAIPPFFWVVFAVYIFFYPLTFNLSFCLYL